MTFEQYPSGRRESESQPPCSGGEQAIARDNQKPGNRIADYFMIIIDDTERATLRQKVLLWAGYTLFMALLFLMLFLCSCATQKSKRVFGPDGFEWRDSRR